MVHFREVGDLLAYDHAIMRRIVIVLLIAFAGFFIGAYPNQITAVTDSIIHGISDGANTAAASLSTFVRTLFAKNGH